MATAKIEITDRDWEDLEPYRDRLGELLRLGLSQVRIQEALLMYRRGVVSIGRAAELAGLSEPELIRQARSEGIEPIWSPEMPEEEMA